MSRFSFNDHQKSSAYIQMARDEFASEGVETTVHKLYERARQIARDDIDGDNLVKPPS